MAAWEEYARLHTRLFPYLYTLAHEASASGAPLMRHPFLEHPDHPELRSVDDAYYFGPSLYVAPVLARGARSVTRLLPPGTFLDRRDQVLVSGAPDRAQTVTLPAPLEKLPLLLRENRLLPLLDASIETLSEEHAPDIVGPSDVADVYDVVGLMTAGGAARFRLWDGEGFEARLSGPIAPPATFTLASDASELARCDGCYRLERLADGLVRFRASARSPSIEAGGLALSGQSRRRIRWDIYAPQSA
jgi:alpha-D-xyloside xylohydrolase